MKIKNLDHLVITAEDVKASLHFYIDILGMAFDGSDNRYSVRFGDQKFNIHQGNTQIRPVARNAAFGTADFCLVAEGTIQEVLAELQEKNVPIELGIVPRTGAQGPMDSVYFRDPDGNLVEIGVYRA
jgi:catechol 2,3-dioxygenase-like lactoylglutathione lyase family enzyme